MTNETSGPRGFLRVPEILEACAKMPDGGSLAEFCEQVDMPKTSLHRMLRTLEHGGYLTRRNGRYSLGPNSTKLGNILVKSSSSQDFAGRARPIMEWLATQTNESVTLSKLSEDENEMIFIDSISSTALLRYTLPIGDHRPVYAGASGKAVLSFRTETAQRSYIERTDFKQTTPYTTRKEELPALLAKGKIDSFVYDRNGNLEGASAIASPIFNADGEVCGAISIAGPTDRLDRNLEQLTFLTQEAGKRITRALGFVGSYPPDLK